MPSTTFTGRRPQYIEQYARTVAAANRYAQIQQAVSSEQAAVQYLDGLIAQERQTLAGLQEIFRTPPQDYSQANQLLKNQYDLEEQSRLQQVGQEAARARAVSLPDTMRQQLENSLLQGPAAFMDTAEAMIRQGTPERADRIIRLAESYQTRLGAQNVENLKGFKQFARPYRPAAGGEGLRAEEEVFSQALEAAYFAGPAGIRGGFEGLEIANIRSQTADSLREQAASEEDEAKAERLTARASALAASAFATGEEALQSALQIVRQTGDPSQIADDYARTVYEEALQTQAYRNDQRADFEPEVLASRQRVARLEAERASAPGAQYTDPYLESIRRELAARGVDVPRMTGKYGRYADSPYYDAIVGADRIVNDLLADPSVELQPVDRPQKLAETLLLQFERTDTDFTLDTLRAQLSKANLTAAELNDALSYALARQEYKTRNLDEPGQRERQRQMAEAEKAASERSRAEAERMNQMVNAERRQLLDIEDRTQARPTTDPAVESAQREYARQRAMGKSVEEARSASLALYGQQATAATQAGFGYYPPPVAPPAPPAPPAPTAFRFAEPLPEPEPAPAPAPQRPQQRPAAPPAVPAGASIPFEQPLTPSQQTQVQAFLSGLEAPAAPPAPAAPAAPPAPVESAEDRLLRLRQQYGVR